MAMARLRSHELQYMAPMQSRRLWLACSHMSYGFRQNLPNNLFFGPKDEWATARLLVRKSIDDLHAYVVLVSGALLAGAGAYADDTAGAAVATGDGASTVLLEGSARVYR